MARLKVVVEISQGFDNDEKKLSIEEQQNITKSLNELVELAKVQPQIRKLYRKGGIIFPSKIKREDSSLYMFKATNTHNVILTYENDPIFKQRIIALYRVIEKKDTVQAFNSIATILYK